MKIRSLLSLAAASIIMMALPICAAAQSPATQSSGPGFLPDSVSNAIGNWLARSDQARAEQPHWMTPLVTVTPRLEQEFRNDQLFQSMAHGESTINFGGSKGIELIPTDNSEIILGIPPYESHQHPGKAGVKNRGTDDFGDWTALVKYRLLSANEESGNYILTAFMGFLAPTGTEHNSQGHAIFTPTFAFGKGWGDFDFQGTLSCGFPDGGLDRLGMPVTSNTAFQYHLYKYFWPEFEVNYTWFPDGEHTGKNEVFLTPGLIAGRIQLYERLALVAGAGWQAAVTRFSRYQNAAIITVRLPF